MRRLFNGEERVSEPQLGPIVFRLENQQPSCTAQEAATLLLVPHSRQTSLFSFGEHCRKLNHSNSIAFKTQDGTDIRSLFVLLRDVS